MSKYRKQIYYTLAIILMFATLLCGFDSNKQRVYDNAELLDASQEELLQKQLVTVGETINADLVIITTTGMDGKTAKQYLEDFHDQEAFGIGQGREAVYLLIDMQNRNYYVREFNLDASGYMLTDDEIDEIMAGVEEKLRVGDYEGACGSFVSLTDHYSSIDYGQNYPESSINYENEHNSSNQKNSAKDIGIRLLISAGVAGISVILMIVTRNDTGKVSNRTYLKGGKVRIRQQSDLFTHTTVVTRKIETQTNHNGGSSSGGSSGGNSGGSHGGGGSF